MTGTEFPYYDLPRLQQELKWAGFDYPSGLATEETAVFSVDENGQKVPLPPETQPVLDAHDPNSPMRPEVFAASEDVERLALINERAATDPAYAALAEFVLRGVQTP
jgi:hypothetical protein